MKMIAIFHQKNVLFFIVSISLFLISCNTSNSAPPSVSNDTIKDLDTMIQSVQLRHAYDFVFINQEPKYIADSFDFPVGKPDAKGYYDAQPFMKNNHLGEDWNAVTGGNSDLGDPIFATANGYVTQAKDYKGGWGNVIRIVHKLNGNPYPYLESLYAHCDEILVEKDQFVKKGQKIATIGNAHGTYYAHLHFELRHKIDMPLGGGYSADTTGFLEPKIFIKANN